jgi:predicted RNA-binding protein with PIN domain
VTVPVTPALQDQAMTNTPFWYGSFWRGILESLLVVSGFAGFGFAWAGLERRDAALSDYPPPPMEATPPAPSLWLVDGFNVLHAGVLHGRDRAQWWTEPRREQLVTLAERFDDAEAEIWIVFDGSGPEAPAEAPAGRVRRIFAPSADDWLLAKVRASEAPACLAVVTADRSVADRARHRGAQVVSPRGFLARCNPASSS